LITFLLPAEQAWCLVAAGLRKKAELNIRAEVHFKRGLATSAVAHWRVLHLRRNIQAMWKRVGRLQLKGTLSV